MYESWQVALLRVFSDRFTERQEYLGRTFKRLVYVEHLFVLVSAFISRAPESPFCKRADGEIHLHLPARKRLSESYYATEIEEKPADRLPPFVKRDQRRYIVEKQVVHLHGLVAENEIRHFFVRKHFEKQNVCERRAHTGVSRKRVMRGVYLRSSLRRRFFLFKPDVSEYLFRLRDVLLRAVGHIFRYPGQRKHPESQLFRQIIQQKSGVLSSRIEQRDVNAAFRVARDLRNRRKNCGEVFQSFFRSAHRAQSVFVKLETGYQIVVGNAVFAKPRFSHIAGNIPLVFLPDENTLPCESFQGKTFRYCRGGDLAVVFLQKTQYPAGDFYAVCKSIRRLSDTVTDKMSFAYFPSALQNVKSVREISFSHLRPSGRRALPASFKYNKSAFGFQYRKTDFSAPEKRIRL